MKMTELTNMHGTLWIVNKDMLANFSSIASDIKRKVVIEKGEILEFRYESPLHFRTMEDSYFYISKEIWIDHLLKIGTILEKVRWENKAKLEEIWRLNLYDSTNEERALCRKIKKEVEESTINRTRGE